MTKGLKDLEKIISSIKKLRQGVDLLNFLISLEMKKTLRAKTPMPALSEETLDEAKLAMKKILKKTKGKIIIKK